MTPASSTDYYDDRITPCARSLTLSDIHIWREMRLRALQDEPEAFRITLEQARAKNMQWWETLAEDVVQNPYLLYLLAEFDSIPAGMIVGRLSKDFTILTISEMWVAPVARRKGVGTKLLNTTMIWGQNNGATVARLHMSDSSNAAKNTYINAGFIDLVNTEPLNEDSQTTLLTLEAIL